MRVSEKYSGRFLKAADLQGRELHVQIAQVAEDVEVGKDKEPKDVLLFFDQKKGLVLNSTNAQILGEVLGDNSDDWLGARIVLYPTETAMGAGIRVRVHSKPTKQGKEQSKLYDEANPPPISATELADIPY